MSTYVMSDLHGCFDEFQNFLAAVGFSDNDHLILAGDLIERGPKNYEMLRWLEEKPGNIITILGNHEYEFAQNIQLMDELCNQMGENPESLEATANIYCMLEERSLYFDYYGSIRELLFDHNASLIEFRRWAQMFRSWPYRHHVNIRNKEYIIVHAGYIDELDKLPLPKQYANLDEFNLYARDEAYIYGGKAHATIIAGHTPTLIRHTFTYNHGRVFRYHDEEIDCVFYDIDCGGVFRYWGETEARLACIHLEDESISYI